MAAVRQKGVNTDFAKEEIARSSMILLDSKARAPVKYPPGSLFVCYAPSICYVCITHLLNMQEEQELQEAPQYSFVALKLLPVGGETINV